MRAFALLACLILLPLAPAAAAAQDVPLPLQDFAWLLGKWERTGLPAGTRGYEHWQVRGNAFVGVGTKLKDERVIFEERLRLEADAAGVAYVADVRENARPVRFILTSLHGQTATFENPTHDFPKRIHYRRDGDRLDVTTSGDGKEVAFHFKRVPAPAPAPAPAQQAIQKQLDSANAAIASAWRAGNAEALAQRYADNAVLMPEHSVARHGPAAISAYYAALFDRLRIDTYRRTSHDVAVYDGFAVQTGNYAMAFTSDAAPRREFRGKFMALWDLRGAEPMLVNELWGADAPFDRIAWPEVVAAAGAVAPPQQQVPMLAEISLRNALIDRLVTERRGAEHARLFLPDAIYLTYYTPMRVGSAQIHDYFVEHEKPGDVVIESLELRSGSLHPLQGRDVVLEEGFYRVAWRAGENAGVVNGKSLNLWKRDQDGTLKLFRQAVNHD